MHSLLPWNRKASEYHRSLPLFDNQSSKLQVIFYASSLQGVDPETPLCTEQVSLWSTVESHMTSQAKCVKIKEAEGKLSFLVI